MDNKKNRLKLKSKVSTTEEKLANLDSEIQPGSCTNVDKNQSSELKDCPRGDDLSSFIKSVRIPNTCNSLGDVLKSLARRRKRVPLESITDLPEFQRNDPAKQTTYAADSLPSLPKMSCYCFLGKKRQAGCVPSTSHLDEKMRSTDSIVNPVQLKLLSVLHTAEAKQKFPGNTSKSEFVVSQKTENLKEANQKQGKLTTGTSTLSHSQSSLFHTCSLQSTLARGSPNWFSSVDAKQGVSKKNFDTLPCTGGAAKSGTAASEELAGPSHGKAYSESVLFRTKFQEISTQLLSAQSKGSNNGRSRSEQSSETSCRVESGFTTGQDRRLDWAPQSLSSDNQTYCSKITLSESDPDKSRERQTLKVEQLRTERGSEASELLTSCPLCLAKFSKGLTQVDIDGHIAACLSASADDIVW